MKKYILSLCFIAATQSGALSAAEYVEVTVDSADIMLAESSADVVGQAPKGMIFSLSGTNGEWHELVLPSGEYRYMQSSLGKTTDDAPELTDDESVLAEACEEYVAAEKRASDEAMSEPDFMKQIDLERLLSDKYKLAVHSKHGIPPARKTALTVWCATH